MTKVKKGLRIAGRVALLLLVSLLIGVRLYSWNAKTLGGDPMPMPFGWGVSVVLSGSMEPTLSVDDVVIVREAETYEVDDIVVYRSGASTLVIHRIISIDGDEIVTQGDDNNKADEPITRSAIKGKAVAVIPYAGLITKPLAFLLILIAAILLFELPYLRQRRKATEEQEKIKEEIRKLKGE